MAVIELPDRQATALKAIAAAQGLTLEQWLGKLAFEEVPSLAPRSAMEVAAHLRVLEQRGPHEPGGLTVREYIDLDRS